MCQKAVGGPFMAWAKVHTEDFAWTRGKPSVFRSSSAAERGFCAACGTPLSFAYLKRPEAISLTLGTFDEPGRVQFTVIDGIEGRWESLDPARLQNLPAHTTAEAPAPEDLSRIQKHQHPDHETP
ncbi:MAG: GFA family protein [Acetobacteraceae bacterium]|nr:GFA family protein [Acetobacteraceae bacterium]